MVPVKSNRANSNASFFTSDRIWRITSPARLSSLTISARISLTSSRLAELVAMKRCAAWALLRIAVSGWFNSCAREAANSPIVDIRLTWASSCCSNSASYSARLRSVISMHEPMYPRKIPSDPNRGAALLTTQWYSPSDLRNRYSAVNSSSKSNAFP